MDTSLPVHYGIEFAGHVIRLWRRTLRPKTINVGVSRLRSLPADQLFEVGNIYLGLTSQASHGHPDSAYIANTLRDRSHCVAGDLLKAHRKGKNEL